MSYSESSLRSTAPDAKKSLELPMAFPDGALRITRTPGRINDKNCVNLADVIHKEHLVSACIFSFFIAKNELFKHLPLSHTSDDIPVRQRANPDLAMLILVNRSTSAATPIPIWMSW